MSGTHAEYIRALNSENYDSSSVDILMDPEAHKKSKTRKFMIGIIVVVLLLITIMCAVFLSVKSKDSKLVSQNTRSDVSFNFSTHMKGQYDLDAGHTCKLGFSPITIHRKDCKKAAETLGFKGDSVSHVSRCCHGINLTTRPPGCFLDSNGIFHFNKGAGGNPTGNDKILCKTATCKTFGGNTAMEGHDNKCVFPFTYGGKKYESCTDKNHDVEWCSTKVYPNGTHVRGHWGNCGPGCPGVMEYENSCFEMDISRSGENLEGYEVERWSSAAECQELCQYVEYEQNVTSCEYFTWRSDSLECFLKSKKPTSSMPDNSAVSGPKFCHNYENTCFENSISRSGENVEGYDVERWSSPAECQILCQNVPSCEFFTWRRDSNECFLKSKKTTSSMPDNFAVSGPKFCHSELPASDKDHDRKLEELTNKTDASLDLLEQIGNQ